jgi:hypothetical protein
MFIYLESSLMTTSVRNAFATSVGVNPVLLSGEGTSENFKRLIIDTVVKEKDDKVYNNAIIGLEVTSVQEEYIYISYNVEVGRVMTQVFNADVKAWKTLEGFRHAHGNAKLALVGTVSESMAELTGKVVDYWNNTADRVRTATGKRDYKAEKASGKFVETAGLVFASNRPSCCLIAIDDKLTQSKDGNYYYKVEALKQYGMTLKTNSSIETIADFGGAIGENQVQLNLLGKVKNTAPTGNDSLC